MQHIASYDDNDAGIVVTVTLLDSGRYAVRVYDTDAEQTLPASRHYATEAAAREYAKQCAGIAARNDNDYLPF